LHKARLKLLFTPATKLIAIQTQPNGEGAEIPAIPNNYGHPAQ